MADTVTTLNDVISEMQEARGFQEETAKNTRKLVKSMKKNAGDTLEAKLKASRGKKAGSGAGAGAGQAFGMQSIADNGLMGALKAGFFLGISKMIAGIVKAFIRVKSFLGKFGGKIKLLARFASKLFLPITLAIGAISGIMAGWEEFTKGNYWEAAELAVKGFFRSIVSIPLDLIKDGVAWLLDKMGFTDTAAVVKDFSFVDLFDGVIGKIFDGVGEAFKVIKDLFTFTDEDKTAMGLLGKLTDIVYAPLNLVINYVRGVFGWNEEGAEPFKLQDYIIEKYNQLIGWFGRIFDWVGNTATTGWTNLTDFVSGKWADTKQWFSDKLNWAGDTIGAGWTGLTGFVGEKWQSVKDFFTEKLAIATDMLPKVDIIGLLGDLYERIKFNFMSSMEGLTIWFMTMPQKIGLALEEEWAGAIGSLKTGFVRFAAWVAGIPDMMLMAGVEKVRSVLGERLSGMVGLDGALSNLEGSRNERDARTADSLSRIDFETADRLARINEKRQELATQQQTLMDARQYVTNNNSTQSQAIVMSDGATPTDVANGGSRWSIVGPR
tara:strand:- start:479 stop:2128 length:1650 start_codon:yes stop_codon:yes gene_type:complete